MRLDGRRALPAACTRCPPSRTGDASYKCHDCLNAGLSCKACFLEMHVYLPFHRCKVWNGSHFEPVSPKLLKRQIPVGHDDGSSCPMGVVHPNFNVLDRTGIYQVDILFCKCERSAPHRTQLLRAELFPSTARRPRTAATLRLLEAHDHMSSHGKISAYEHYTALEQMTDGWGIEIPKPKYKPFLRIIRKHGYILMMKRGGRGCKENGVETTLGGQLAIPCPACPREGVNIPLDWQTLGPDERRRYMLILMMDANFRLCNIRRSSTLDPGLGTGLAYLVADKPYHDHYSKYKVQTDISTCSGFKTLEMAEKKDATGLRSTGLGMVACARHEIIRPEGVGDLQKGERYCNMDYVAMSAAKGVNLDRFYSYDVSCQWCIHLMDRIKDLPPHLQPPPGVKLSYGVPKCHAKGHILVCQCCFSMGLQLGVGNTDGEGIERVWAGINHSAASTKESLPGHRHDTLDRRMATHNWEKVIRLGKHLHGSLNKAIDRYTQQLADHEDFTRQIPAQHTHLIQKWKDLAEDWEHGRSGDRKDTTPYWRERSYVREKDLILQLNEEDRRAARQAIHEVNVVSFLVLGLKIEQNQRTILLLLTSEDKEAAHVVDDVQSKRLTMKRMLQEFRSVQQIYMPFIPSFLAARAGERDGDIETEQLYLPSALPVPLRARCLDDAPAVEERMRETQCFSALEDIRGTQRAVHTVRSFKKANVRGTKRSGRSFDLIKRLSLKAKTGAQKYEASHRALKNLRGSGDWELILRELKPDDIRGLSSEVFTTDMAIDYDEEHLTAGEKRKRNGTGRGMKPAEVLVGSSSFMMSWIWTIDGALDSASDDEMNGLIRVEYLKSRARVERAREEMLMLRDERERTLVSLEYDAKAWEQQAGGWPGMTVELAEGVAAYCAKQAGGRRKLADHFRLMWMKEAPVQKIRVQDRIEVQQDDGSDSEREDDVSPANELRGPLAGLREVLTSHDEL
ncbi:hypothetical protein CYLTODRAFT_384282 [Cylindrobasidium torrendii FP15055 ss-10]|uniref:CxC2-like cysteine cluster KDZ transposase-associated domain-containing protein n=1 Tax=Cylindrobasidium torrendii FP15055 ss-10 TaxID=1314674 RepID=A0A0D7ATX4_9AGAR|nr:hypothetical protein CYLTODRAFT_384282 [Cylindrobasidium torrendii FP15055 ss-10]